MTATDDGTPLRSSPQAIVLDVSANPHPWQNPDQPLDTNNDLPHHAVVALDALIIFNLLNNLTSLIDATGRLPPVRPANSDLPFYDTSGDGFCTSLDALLIINELNNRPVEAEGESRQTVLVATPPVDLVSPDPPYELESRSCSPDLERALSAIAEDVTLAPKSAFRRRWNVPR